MRSPKTVDAIRRNLAEADEIMARVRPHGERDLDDLPAGFVLDLDQNAWRSLVRLGYVDDPGTNLDAYLNKP